MSGIVQVGPAAVPFRSLYLHCSAAKRTTTAVRTRVQPLIPSRKLPMKAAWVRPRPEVEFAYASAVAMTPEEKTCDKRTGKV